MSDPTVTPAPTAPRTSPTWFVHTAWRVHRALLRLDRDRFLWEPGGRRGWGAMQVTTTGRRSGVERSVVLAYLEDGPALVTLAMNGWGEGHPAWWLNLEADPRAVVRRRGGRPLPYRARVAVGEERERLWQRFAALDATTDAHAARRATVTPVVVLEPAL